MKNVLIFDSGVGGLSIYKEIAKVLPSQPIIYAFDNAAFPYGELADDVLVERVCSIISTICEQHDVALVVIACNTASTLVLPPLRDLLSIPVVGVVPAIKLAAAITENKKVGLLATPATIRRDYTFQLINEFMPDCEVELVGSTQLVQMVEDKLRGKGINKTELKSLLQPFDDKGVDVIVLGCTHFPLVKKELANALGDGYQLVDSGEAISRRVVSLLSLNQSKAKTYCEKMRSDNVQHRVFSSAVAFDEDVLNQNLKEIGLPNIERIPNFLAH